MTIATTSPSPRLDPWRELLHPNVLVAALGYFVDVYDVLLFTVIRRPSLEALGVRGDALVDEGIRLMNAQMLGMLLGGFLWGIWGDKRGRISVLYGSILVYSLANIANASVHSVEAYAVWRFIAGFGLAGELGAAITLVSEVLSAEARGYATGLVASCGAAGVVVASLVGELFPWRWAFVGGGAMGLLLLVLRMRTMDSALFAKMNTAGHGLCRGDLRLLLRPRRLRLFLSSVLAGSPIWLMSGVLGAFAPELTRLQGATGEVKASLAIFAGNFGVLLGDFGASVLSQWLKSRKKVIVGAVVGASVFVALFLSLRQAPPWAYAVALFGVGICAGNWAVIIATSAEQFGTNLRATVTTCIPNLVRALVIPMTLSLEILRPQLGLWGATVAVAAGVLTLALVGSLQLGETFQRDLDFVESDS